MRKLQVGMSLVEVVTVIAVIAVLIGTAVPGLRALIDDRHAQGTADEVFADLLWIKSESLARSQGLRMHFGAVDGLSCYVLHTGPAGSCACAADGSAMCTGTAVALKVRLQDANAPRVQANVTSMLFDPASGTVVPTASITVVPTTGRTLRHVVNILGRVRTCAPEGKTGGYRSC